MKEKMMKTKHFLLSVMLLLFVVQPVFAMCIGGLLQEYVKNPKGVTAPGVILASTHLALVKIVAVHPDNKSSTPTSRIGTLDLKRVESTDKAVPAVFSIPYEQRQGPMLMDCQTWDSIELKPGGVLLGFFKHEQKGWVIPELPASGVVSNRERIDPVLWGKVQKMLRKG